MKNNNQFKLILTIQFIVGLKRFTDHFFYLSEFLFISTTDDDNDYKTDSLNLRMYFTLNSIEQSNQLLFPQ